MEQIKEMVEDRRAILKSHYSEDMARKNDRIVGRFMEGRAVIENEEAEWLDKLLEVINKRI